LDDSIEHENNQIDLYLSGKKKSSLRKKAPSVHESAKMKSQHDSL